MRGAGLGPTEVVGTPKVVPTDDGEQAESKG